MATSFIRLYTRFQIQLHSVGSFFSVNGALVKVERTNMLQGSNLISIDLKSMTNGVNHLETNWNKGQ